MLSLDSRSRVFQGTNFVIIGGYIRLHSMKKRAYVCHFVFMLFVLTLSVGLEGYHVNVDGRHITSFSYQTGFTLEDATGLTVNGDIDVHSIFDASLPTSHPSFAPQRHLEMSNMWKAPPLSERPVDLFIGVLSAGNHFAERMVVRKSWMQHKLVKSSNVVARFFVAMHARKEVNVELKREAEFFRDIVIVPYMDNYDLVVLKIPSTMETKVCQFDEFVHIYTSRWHEFVHGKQGTMLYPLHISISFL